uniref:Uncharacterized protein n=1 Tax=Anguilla anguilla TaxID=7936 RepID=A0A0E9QBY8_ANGAN
MGRKIAGLPGLIDKVLTPGKSYSSSFPTHKQNLPVFITALQQAGEDRPNQF